MPISFIRFFLVFIVYLSTLVVLAFIVFNLLRRNLRNRLNQIFFSFFIFLAIGIILNSIYLSFSDPNLSVVASFLNLLAMYFSSTSGGFLLLYVFILYLPNRMQKLNNQIIFMIFYFGLYLPLFFIPYGLGVQILPGGLQLSPVWSASLSIYLLFILSTHLLVNVLISLKVYKAFKTQILKKKFKLFVLGVIILYYIPIGVTLTNFLDIPLLRIIFGFTAPIVIGGLILIYYGIGKPINRRME